MRVLLRSTRRVLALVLCLCTLMTLIGCADFGGLFPTEPAEPQVTGPANVRVLALNVAYYDGEFTDNQHLVKLNYSNQTVEDYTFDKRADRLKVLLEEYEPDVFFLNEFNFAWWKEVITDEDAILKTLSKYTYVDSRSTGSSKNGEGDKYLDLYNMVFYDQEQFTLVDTGSFVTCQTWGGWYDHCTWAKLLHKESGQTAVYAAIHVQTVPDTQRAVLSLQAASKAVETLYEVAEGLPVILGGDFNTTEESRGHITYDYMVNQAGFKDCRYAAPQTDSSGTARIWGSSLKNNGNRIDYIFVNGAGVKKYEVANGSFTKDNTYVEEVTETELAPGKDCDYYDISDHLPVVSDIILKGAQSTAPTVYTNPVGENDVAATPTGSYTDNGGTAEKIIFNFSDALDYVGGVNKQGFTASLVENEEYGAVLKLEAQEHITAGYISIDCKKLMEASGLTALDMSDYGKMKITYLAETSYTAEGGILKLSTLRDGAVYPTDKNSLGITTYGKWHTQTMFFSSISGEVNGPVNAFSIYNANGALKGDAIYIAAIEFTK